LIHQNSASTVNVIMCFGISLGQKDKKFFLKQCYGLDQNMANILIKHNVLVLANGKSSTSISSTGPLIFLLCIDDIQEILEYNYGCTDDTE